jgi:hypothetical protein
VIKRSRILGWVAIPAQVLSNSSLVRNGAGVVVVIVLIAALFIGSPIVRYWLNGFFFSDVNYLTVLEPQAEVAPKPLLR